MEFSITTSSLAKKYRWYFKEKQLVPTDDATLDGCFTDNLVIAKCLPKHTGTGTYKCVVTDEFGEDYTSKSATLTIGKYVHAHTHTFLPSV